MLNTLKSQQNEVWYYRFDWDEEPAPFNDIYGAAHAFDLPFVFGNFGPSLFSNIANTTANRPGRLALSDAMMQQPRRLRAAAATRTAAALGVDLAGVAVEAALRRDAHRQGHLGAVARYSRPAQPGAPQRQASRPWWCVSP